MFLGIEIGGTKLQLALGRGDSPEFTAFWRGNIDAGQGAAAIRTAIQAAVPELLQQAGIARETVRAVGIAFGGPVDADAGETLISHQVAGWGQFPLTAWVRDQLGWPATLQNDADSAAFAEARFGAGAGYDPVLYLTVGSGIGGGLVHRGQVYRGSGAGAVEIGHLRPGQLPRHIPEAGATVEQIASGFGITTRAKRTIQDWQDTVNYVASQHRENSPHRATLDPLFQQKLHPSQERFGKLLTLAGGDPNQIDTRLIAAAAAAGDRLSLELLADATHAIGWAIAQAITLLNPARIVIGGGVSLIGEELFFEPIRRTCRQHVFEPFANIAEIVPAQLGEEVVVHGALALAAGMRW